MIGIIGGTGIYEIVEMGEEVETKVIETPYGESPEISIFKLHDKNIAFMPRHAKGHANPPHMINYRANIWAIHTLGIKRVLSTNSVGSMRGHPVGSFVLLDDFIDFTRSRPSTFYDDTTVHVDVSEPYCPEIKHAFKAALEKQGFSYTEGVYACTEGPRFETRAEIRMMSQFADIVGMTGVPEVTLAKELSLCYASLAIVTNQACGMATEKLTADEVTDVVGRVQESIFQIISNTIEFIPESRSCACRYAKDGACL